MKKNTLFYLSILFYLGSMLLPVTGFDWGFIGFQAFYMGLSTLMDFEIFFFLSWLANFTYLSVLLLRNRNVTLRIIVALFTVILSLFSLIFFKFPFQEGGRFDFYFGPGYLLWILSFVLLLVSQVKEKTSKTN